MPDTKCEDDMAFLGYDGPPIQHTQPIQHYLGGKLRAMYDALPLPLDPQLDDLARQLEARHQVCSDL